MCGALATSAPVGVEHRAGEVEPLLDVHREAVFCSVTPICSAIDMNRLLNTSSITGSAWCRWRGAPCASTRGQHQMVERRRCRLPAGLDHDGLVVLDDDQPGPITVARRSASRS
jgi:hypothetical protein